ncbi:MAG: DUF1684 domain-containing protein [Flavobacteriaceae bacterium]
MKNIFAILSLLVFMSCNSQGKRPIVGETEYQRELNAQYKDASKSPLKKKDLKNFKGLDFFPIDSAFIVTAKLTRTPDSPIFEMATTTSRKPLYREYGLLTFTLQGKEHTLTIYQSQSNLDDPEYKDYLFLPFTDDTSGEESYGGGRYMDAFLSKISADDTMVLNFNNTYNPYCAYNEAYSCPITPRKNHLDIAIKAGVKKFK